MKPLGESGSRENHKCTFWGTFCALFIKLTRKSQQNRRSRKASLEVKSLREQKPSPKRTLIFFDALFCIESRGAGAGGPHADRRHSPRGQHGDIQYPPKRFQRIHNHSLHLPIQLRKHFLSIFQRPLPFALTASPDRQKRRERTLSRPFPSRWHSQRECRRCRLTANTHFERSTPALCTRTHRSASLRDAVNEHASRVSRRTRSPCS